MIDGEVLFSYIGTCIRDRRKALGLTQSEVAAQLGLKRTSIANLEAGQQRLPLDLLYQLCVVLELDIATVMPSMDLVMTSIPDEVVVSGFVEKVPPKTALLVRTLRDRLQEK